MKVNKIVMYVIMCLIMAINVEAKLIANAGVDKNITLSASVRAIFLDASDTKSTQDIVAYKWYEDGKFIGSGMSRWYLLKENGIHTFTLKVTDIMGNISIDTVDIHVFNGTKKDSIAPIVNAGVDKVIDLDNDTNSVLLEGSVIDTDNNIVRYRWYKGNQVIGINQVVPYSLSDNGVHNFTFEVTDADNNVVKDSLKVTIKNGNSVKLIAKAGLNQTFNVTPSNKAILLNATRSESDYLIKSYKWYKNEIYIGSGASRWVQLLENGIYTFRLVVTDSLSNVDTDTMTVTVINGIEPKKEKTSYNQEYHHKMINEQKSLQETPWGFQEISLLDTIEHNINTIQEYINIVKTYRVVNLIDNELKWKDNKVHIINFSEGNYTIPNGNSYYSLLVPSKTIIQGAGIGRTIFSAKHELDENHLTHFRALFNLEFASHDVVVRDISFYNETKDNKWVLFHANGSTNRENYLFENIEFDDVFGAIGKSNYTTNFITFRGLKKRIGNTSQRIKNNFTLPVPRNYDFYWNNNHNVSLAGQIGVREGNSVVFHNCELGDVVSATIDIYSNYVEIVGVKFIDPLHDHSIKNPKGNHLYIHDSKFELTYDAKLIEGAGYWNPTFFTHEITNDESISLRKNYHFKNLEFKRKYKVISAISNDIETEYRESEPFTIYDESDIRNDNVSGDMIWENISFEGYSSEHEVVGYPNVQIAEGYKALNYTSSLGVQAQMKSGNNNGHGTYLVNIEKKEGSSRLDNRGVYSWGNKKNGTIDFPRDNRLYDGNKSISMQKPYIKMYLSTEKNTYNQRLE